LTVLLEIASAQTQRWVYTLNGTGDSRDEANCLLAAGDIYIGGMVGNATTFGDWKVLSLSSGGAVNWSYEYNGPANSTDYARAIARMDNGMVVVVGASTGSGTETDMTCIGLSPTGGEQFVYRYDGPANYEDVFLGVDVNASGAIYCGGRSDSTNDADFTVVSLSQAGAFRWRYRYDGTGQYEDGAGYVTCGDDGYIYAAGYSWSAGRRSSDAVLISLDDNGSQRWVYRLAGPNEGTDEAAGLAVGGGAVYLAATSDSAASDIVVVSLNPATGVPFWTYRYDVGGRGQTARAITVGADNNIYVAGYSNELDATYGVIISLAPSGSVNWVYRCSRGSPSQTWLRSIDYGTDGNLYSFGQCYNSVTRTGWDALALSLTTAGALRWQYLYNGADSLADQFCCGAYNADGNVYAAGIVTDSTRYEDLLAVSLNPAAGVAEGGRQLLSKGLRLDCASVQRGRISYTLGARVQAEATMILYDRTGARVAVWQSSAGTAAAAHACRRRGLTTGVYVLRAEASGLGACSRTVTLVE